MWKRIGQGRKTPKLKKGRKPKYRPDAGRKAKEFGIAKAEAALIAEANDKKNVPLQVVLFELNALRFQFSWIKIFGATLKRPGHYKIWFKSSPKHTVDEDYTPLQGVKGAGRITAESLKELKQLVNQLSKPGSKLTQQELNQLKILAEKHGGKVRLDLEGVKGTGVKPHAHIEGLGKKVESRHIWLEDGIK